MNRGAEGRAEGVLVHVLLPVCLPLPLYRVVMKLRGRQFTPDGTHLFATHNRSHLESGEPEIYKIV